jgi:hypothetical protein
MLGWVTVPNIIGLFLFEFDAGQINSQPLFEERDLARAIVILSKPSYRSPLSNYDSES